MVGRPNVFSSGELKLATDNFSPQNILGEGGYGPVYKVGYSNIIYSCETVNSINVYRFCSKWELVET
jgi:hypothetical protein